MDSITVFSPNGIIIGDYDQAEIGNFGMEPTGDAVELRTPMGIVTYYGTVIVRTVSRKKEGE